MNRRDFLKGLGAALGGALFAGRQNGADEQVVFDTDPGCQLAINELPAAPPLDLDEVAGLVAECTRMARDEDWDWALSPPPPECRFAVDVLPNHFYPRVACSRLRANGGDAPLCTFPTLLSTDQGWFKTEDICASDVAWREIDDPGFAMGM